MGEVAAMLAHQGGWDEILPVVAPVALFAVLFTMARSRAARSDRRDEPHPLGST